MIFPFSIFPRGRNGSLCVCKMQASKENRLVKHPEHSSQFIFFFPWAFIIWSSGKQSGFFEQTHKSTGLMGILILLGIPAERITSRGTISWNKFYSRCVYLVAKLYVKSFVRVPGLPSIVHFHPNTQEALELFSYIIET